MDAIATMHLKALECEINDFCVTAAMEEATPGASFGERVGAKLKWLSDKILGAIRWILGKIAKARDAVRSWFAKRRNKGADSSGEGSSSNGKPDRIAAIAGGTAAAALPAHQKSTYQPNKQFGPEAPGSKRQIERPAKADNIAAITDGRERKAAEKAEKARQDAKKNHSDNVHTRRTQYALASQEKDQKEDWTGDYLFLEVYKYIHQVDQVISRLPGVAQLATMDESSLDRVSDEYSEEIEIISSIRGQAERAIGEFKNEYSGKLVAGPRTQSAITRLLTELDNSEKIYRQMEKEMRAAASKFHAFDSVKSKSKIALSNQADKAGFSKEGGGGDTGRYKAFISATNKALNVIMAGIQLTSKLTSVLTNLSA